MAEWSFNCTTCRYSHKEGNMSFACNGDCHYAPVVTYATNHTVLIEPLCVDNKTTLIKENNIYGK